MSVSTELNIFYNAYRKNSKVCLSLSPGVSSGAILVFDVPSKGSNITLSEVLEEHKESITDLASECSCSQVYMWVCVCVCVQSV